MLALDLRLEAPTTRVPYKETSGTFKLFLTNRGADRQFRVELGRPLLKAGDAAGRATLPAHRGADWAEVHVAKDVTVPLDVRVDGLSRLGLYEGTIRVWDTAPSKGESVRSYQVLRESSGFDLKFKGDGVTNDVLTLKPKDSGDEKFSFVIENPLAGADVELKSEVSSNFGGSDKPAVLALASSAPVRLSPGSTETFELRVKELPATGDYQARLKFTDISSGATKQLDVRLQPSFIRFSHWTWIVGLVAVGALLSAFVGVAVPTQASRQRLIQRLDDARRTLDALPSSEQAAKDVMGRGIRACKEMVEGLSWYLPSAAERLAEHQKRVEVLEQRIELLTHVRDQRNTVQNNVNVPSSLLAPLSAELDSIAEAVAKESVELARERVALFKQKLISVLATSDLATLIKETMVLPPTDSGAPGAKVFVQPETELAKVKAAAGAAHSVMVSRLEKLLANHKASVVTPPSRPLLLAMDYESQCADLYFRRYLDGVVKNRPDDIDYVAAAVDLVELLRKGRGGLIDAMVLVDNLERGVTKAAVERALADLPANAHVVAPSPTSGEYLNFALDFKAKGLNGSTLLQGTPVQWIFRSAKGTTVLSGLTVSHLHKGDKTQETELEYEVWVGHKVPDDSQKLKGKLTMPRREGKFLWKAEVTSFGITLAGAVVLAVLTNYGEARPMTELKDYLNPFLWGFGADRLKSLVAARL